MRHSRTGHATRRNTTHCRYVASRHQQRYAAHTAIRCRYCCQLLFREPVQCGSAQDVIFQCRRCRYAVDMLLLFRPCCSITTHAAAAAAAAMLLAGYAYAIRPLPLFFMLLLPRRHADAADDAGCHAAAAGDYAPLCQCRHIRTFFTTRIL